MSFLWKGLKKGVTGDDDQDDEEKDVLGDGWDTQSGFTITEKGKKATKQDANGSWRSAYGRKKITRGKHEWIVELNTNPNSQNSCYICIGIANNCTQLQNCIVNTERDSLVWYSTQKYYYSGASVNTSIGQYAPGSGKLRIALDMDKKTCAFYYPSTNKSPVFTHEGLAPGGWRLALSYVTSGDSCTIVKSSGAGQVMVETDSILEDYEITTKWMKKRLADKASIKKIPDDILYEMLGQCKKSGAENEKLVSAILEHDKTIKEFEKEFNKMIHPDSKSWEEWNHRNVLRWILSLEGGRYGRYIKTLQAELAKQEVTGTDLKDFEKGDLKVFGISKFKDRTDLYNYIQQLVSGSTAIGPQQDGEGAADVGDDDDVDGGEGEA